MSDRDNSHLNDAGLEALAAQIDRLGFADSEQPGLEARVLAASVSSLRGGAGPLKLVGTAPTVRHTPVHMLVRSALRIAAVVALASAAGLVWISHNRVVPASPTAVVAGAGAPASADEWAIMSAVVGDGRSAELDEVLTTVTSLHEKMGTLGTSDAIEEGAM